MTAAQPSVPQGPTSQPLARLHNVMLALGRSQAQDVRFHLPELRLEAEERLALTGPSGCGKSTLLNLVAGLVRPTSGTVEVCGQDLSRLSTARLDTFRGRNLGFIHQTFNLLETFTALENVLVGMRFGRGLPHRERKARAEALLDRVGLSHRTHARPSRLSVGERQRVAIARALANKPRLLLADEPTGALDPRTGEEVFRLILEVCEQERCGLLFVTHDLALAGRLPRGFDCRGLVTTGGAAS